MELRDLKNEITKLIINRSRRVHISTVLLKFSVLLLSAIAGWASFELAPPTTPADVWSIAGRIACGLIFLVAVALLFNDGDSATEMRRAHDALNKAEELEQLRPTLNENIREITRLSHLFVALQLMRSVLEQSVRKKISDDNMVITLLFDFSKQPLPVAMDFDISDEWTICVYKAEYNTASPDVLKCVAHTRAIPCDIAKARPWNEGVGVAGISYANRREVIVPDLRAGNLGNLFNVGPNERSYDEKRYRSFAVVPISLDANSKPWGVVVATSSKPNHFSPHPGPGLKTAEAVRILAGMIALAVTCCEAVA